MKKIIIIPDIHGRTFWKDIVNKNEKEDIIFLGDYLDPYTTDEGITADQALNNFKEIIEFKKSHMRNVTLLLGNHDLGGYICSHMTKCRFDYKNYKEIEKLFTDNINFFKVIVFRDINSKNVSFSHSFIGQNWINDVYKFKKKSVKYVTNFLNRNIKQLNTQNLYESLDYISYRRYGMDLFGSCVWSDIVESEWRDNYPTDIDYQIFGHTQLEKPYITNKIACLDVRDGFIIDNGILLNENYNVNVEI